MSRRGSEVCTYAIHGVVKKKKSHGSRWCSKQPNDFAHLFMELKIAKIWKDATNVYLKMKTTQTQQTNKITSENRNKHKQILQLVEVQPKGTTTIRHLKLCVWEM